ncbi:MAG TPA: EAL domain-containing protein [Caulobacteraceae bacterium]|jgi:cyclic-di-GMP phosphodiesterase TipF (flagellum assembly factor)|nr:EAL domain-containing protein [Caulobacteraceae bacterium]
MRKVTEALLAGAYLCLALTVALLVWRGGGGVGAGIAALAGVLGLAFALHGMVGRDLGRAGVARELRALREANQILADQLDVMHERLAGFAESVQEDVDRRSEELTTEVRVLEDLVQRMSDSLEDRLAQTPQVPPAYVRHHHQHTALLETVREALADNRVDLYLQPVVSLPQRRTVFYESFSRLRDGSGRVMMPAEYLSVAEPEGLMPAIDNLLLFRCVQIVRRLAKNDRKVGIFCNVALGSLADESFFPQFLEFLAENRDLSGALIFELGQSAFDRRGSTEARNMGKLADLGFRFSLDKVSDLDLNFPDLARADVKFVKVSAEVLLSQLLELDGRLALRSLKDLNAADLADLTRRYGVELIAEKVETERQVVDVLELNIAYGQGNLFGEPRAIRDAVLAEADPPADFIRSSLRRRVVR